MKKHLAVILMLIAAFTLKSQDIKNSVGIRGGFDNGINYTAYTGIHSEAEALLTFREGGIQAGIFSKKFYPVLLEYSDHFFLHYGIGGHIGYVSWVKGYKVNENGFDSYKFHNYYAPVIGADFSASIEYRLYRIPFSIALDFKPYFEFPGRHFFSLNLWDFGLCFKYNF
jgi:hypothetical protein